MDGLFPTQFEKDVHTGAGAMANKAPASEWRLREGITSPEKLTEM